MTAYLWVALGSALGGVARYALTGWAAAWLGQSFPWGTLAINILGSLVIGAFAAWSGPAGRLTVSTDIRLFVMVGVCGGFTTFSAFSLQTLTLAQQGQFARAGLNVVMSVTLCLVAVWLGHLAASAR